MSDNGNTNGIAVISMTMIKTVTSMATATIKTTEIGGNNDSSDNSDIDDNSDSVSPLSRGTKRFFLESKGLFKMATCFFLSGIKKMKS